MTAGISFTAGFNIEVVSFSTTVSVSATAGKSATNSKSESETNSVTVEVPAKHSVTVQMVATMKTETVEFSAPITADGMFGGNFGSPVQGHYFWFLSASTVLGSTSGVLKGTFQNSRAFDVTTNVLAAVPIT